MSNICCKTLAKAGHLKMHKQSVHDNLRPHECDIGSRTFNEVTALSRDKKIIHD